MSNTDLVRASRDGDQFHYVWAARRCLLLLSPNAHLKAITIEGPSLHETEQAISVDAGEELIDVGEYYGSENLSDPTRVRYIQIKNSTVRSDKPFVPSELEKTIKGFAKRYKEFQAHIPLEKLNEKLEFWFVSRQPINEQFLEAIEDAANNSPARHAAVLKKLERFTTLTGIRLSAFCKLLRMQGNQEELWDQKNMLAQDTSHYLADADIDAPILLKELVTKRALSESKNNPSITKIDVLRALKTDESRLYPAPCQIKDAELFVPREQEPALIQSIIDANDLPVIVHADGGVGKSVFATRIKTGLPPGSVNILYDCFGDGLYRSASSYRHRHQDALVQIANELASLGICHPLIPTPHADSSAYAKAFLYRLRQGITSLRSKNSCALICIVIDAADNAQMAAEEAGDGRSFALDLIREVLPEGVRLVFLCRTHRQDLLNPSTDILRLKLNPFSRAETATFLRNYFNGATEPDIDEFHRLSSQNPRVQSLALSQNIPLDETLRALGPNPTTVEDTIGRLLDSAIAKLKDAAVTLLEKKQIESICAGMASLRPLVPLSVLAQMSGVDEAAIKSFALDLGRPLLISGDTIQFFDEPAETWFRERFKPISKDLISFIETLKPLASDSAYVAATLPQLMLEAGQLTELVALALSTEALPTANPIDKRDVELQRLQFALKASLRAKRYLDAAKLALKAGGECAGDERQNSLLQSNTDLAAVFMERDRILELVSRKTFGSGWIGSHHAYEAGLLSGQNELLGDARSRLRMAGEWLRNWQKLTDDEKRKEPIKDADLLEITMAIFNIHGPEQAAQYIRRWSPPEVSYRVGYMLATRLIDQGRYSDLNSLALAAGNNFWLSLSAILALREVHRTPAKEVVERTLRLVSSHRVSLGNDEFRRDDHTILKLVTALVETAIKVAVGNIDGLYELLKRYLPETPPRILTSRFAAQRFVYLKAYALQATLKGQNLNLIDLAHPDLREEMEAKKTHSEAQNQREFKSNIGALLPWHKLWVQIFCGSISRDRVDEAISEALEISTKIQKSSCDEVSNTTNEIAQVWFDILVMAERVEVALIEQYRTWINNLKQPLFIPTLTKLARIAAHMSLPQYSLEFAEKACALSFEIREDAASKSEGFINLARSVLPVSRSEAAEYFNLAVEIASKIGDENISRWDAFLNLANQAADKNNPNAKIAYRLARYAELTDEYAGGDNLNWEDAIEALAGLGGSTALAIFSRWRDRRFGPVSRILPLSIGFLIERGDLDPKIAIALMPFRFNWDYGFLLEKALNSAANRDERKSILHFAMRYIALEKPSINVQRNILQFLNENGSPDYGIIENIKLKELHSQKNTDSDSEGGSALFAESKFQDNRSWDEIFEGLELISSGEIALAYRRFKSAGPPYHLKDFFEEASRRVGVGKESQFIDAIAKVIEFDLYDIRYFFDKIPETWKSRLAVKTALERSLKLLCRRFCMAITKHRYYAALPLKTVCKAVDISEKDLIEVVLEAIGEATQLADSNRLFTLVGLLSSQLNAHEAADALSFGLDLMEPSLDGNVGDGVWSEKLRPVTEIDACIAGYVWSCLAAPEATARWEAAHVVRAFCTLHHTNVIGHLISYFKGGSATAFYDNNLYFYEQHAKQWLLIGLARAAKDYPKFIANYAPLFIKCVFEEDPHVLMREFARQILLTLCNAGLLPDQDGFRSRLENVNGITLKHIESESYRRDESEGLSNEAIESENDAFYFGIDFGPYWLKPLASCFSISQNIVQREALQVIRSNWLKIGTGGWNEDERHRRKIFHEREAVHSHGSYPSTDELRFYLCYHAMMIVAGRMLQKYPPHAEKSESNNSFCDWMNRHNLVRNDGYWLADRRDPTPIGESHWKNQRDSEEWRWSLSREDFDENLLASNDRINLWGCWTNIAGRRKENITISSALVSVGTSAALLRALQSTLNPHDFCIPDEDDYLQISFEEFQLKGWVTDQRGYCSGIDENDPWAGNIKYPPLKFAPYIVTLMNLESDHEKRGWFIKSSGCEVAWAQTWGNFNDKDNDENEQENGSRFQASFSFVKDVLSRLNMDLIIKVEIERRHFYSRWEKNDDKFGFILPSARLFLIRSDGRIQSA